MCGRYLSSSSADEISHYFGAQFPEDWVADPPIEPNFNVAPTDEVFVIRQRNGVRTLNRFRWGLVPNWAKDRSGAAKMINARG